MKTGIRDQRAGISTAEETLRLLARLSAPEGLEERVQNGLRVAAHSAERKVRILHWPAWLRRSSGWMQSAPMRAVAAVAIVAVVVGGGWMVSSRIPAAQPATAQTIPARVSAQGGFASAEAMRTPHTLNGPTVTPSVAISPAPAMAADSAHAKKVRHGGSSAIKRSGGRSAR